MQKRILFLGGAASQIPPIVYAKEQGHYVITCDYLPENPAHKYADEYYNISTTDKELVLNLARELKIDGIVAYASDPAAPTQAYVGNKLGLPSNPYKSVLILTRKDLFRDFLKNNNFFVPKSNSFHTFKEAQMWLAELKMPVIIKPIDSSGSKGITKIEATDEFQVAFEYALQYSKIKKVIIEEFLIRDSYQIGGDGFIVDGQLVFSGMTNTHFDSSCNSLAPIGGSLPSVLSKDKIEAVNRELQRLLTLLNMKQGALNFEFQYDASGNIMIIEVAARNGGNRIPELINYAMNVDMIKYTVDSALGIDCSDIRTKEVEGFYSYYVLHALKNGTMLNIHYSNEIKKHILKEFIYFKTGESVMKFNSSDCTVGLLIMKFSSQKEMLHKMDNMNNYIKVEIE